MVIEPRVVRSRCMGSGNCGFHAPRTFDLDDDMVAVVIGAGDGEAAVRRAVAGCPTQAIELIDAVQT